MHLASLETHQSVATAGNPVVIVLTCSSCTVGLYCQSLYHALKGVYRQETTASIATMTLYSIVGKTAPHAYLDVHLNSLYNKVG